MRVFLFNLLLIYIRQKNNAMLIIPGDNTADFRVSVCPILTNMDDDLDESAVTGANRKGVVWNFFKVSQDDDTHAILRKYRDTYRIVTQVSRYVSYRQGTVSLHLYLNTLTRV